MEQVSTCIKATSRLLRVGLAASFLSAVADRFGLFGAPGSDGVSWGDWASFVEYVALLNDFLPASVIPTLAWIATCAEVLLALGLLIGWQLRTVAFASGLLLASFALTMTLALGLKAPLDYSVFTAASSALLLGSITPKRQA